MAKQVNIQFAQVEHEQDEQDTSTPSEWLSIRPEVQALIDAGVLAVEGSPRTGTYRLTQVPTIDGETVEDLTFLAFDEQTVRGLSDSDAPMRHYNVATITVERASGGEYGPENDGRITKTKRIRTSDSAWVAKYRAEQAQNARKGRSQS